MVPAKNKIGFFIFRVLSVRPLGQGVTPYLGQGGDSPLKAGGAHHLVSVPPHGDGVVSPQLPWPRKTPPH